jgi:hypothetical protein
MPKRKKHTVSVLPDFRFVGSSAEIKVRLPKGRTGTYVKMVRDGKIAAFEHDEVMKAVARAEDEQSALAQLGGKGWTKTAMPKKKKGTKNPKDGACWLEYEKTAALAELDRAAVAGGADPDDLRELRQRVKEINKELGKKRRGSPKRNPGSKKAVDVLGKPDVVSGMKFGSRYKYNHGIFIDYVADEGLFHVSQAGRPSKKLGTAKTLAQAEKIAREKGDFSQMLGAKATTRGAKPKATKKQGKKQNPETAIAPVEPAPKKITKKMMQPVTRQFNELVKVAAKDMEPVKYTRLVADPTVHTTPRAYGMAGIEDGWPVIKVAPELADQPASVILGVLAHEIGHILIMLGREAMRSGYDSSERQADEVAESVFGKKIFYNENGVQCAGRGARGKRPRPRGLR